MGDHMAEQKKSRREVLEAFVAEKPDDAFSRYGLALEYMNSGDAATAETQFRELIQRNPSYVPGYQMLGQLLAKQSRSEDARSILNQGIAAASKAGNAHAQSEMESLLAEL
jgi:Tfp pilus assembly protein PilF